VPWRLGRCLLIANLKAGFWCAAAVCCLAVRGMGPAREGPLTVDENPRYHEWECRGISVSRDHGFINICGRVAFVNRLGESQSVEIMVSLISVGAWLASTGGQQP
jgi:hypothetical protein